MSHSGTPSQPASDYSPSGCDHTVSDSTRSPGADSFISAADTNSFEREPVQDDQLHPHYEPYFSDYDEDDDVGYTLEDDNVATEDPNKYVKGGFHPVHLGDILADGPHRFRVFHKLGEGGFGTVWLCRDLSSQKWRAVKVMAAHDEDKPIRDSYPELLIKDRLHLASSGDYGLYHLGIPFQYFFIDGPNGRHLCSVMPLLGPRLSEVFNYYGLQQHLLKDICYQLAESIKFLHSHGVCHGDFRPDNILFLLADGVDEWSEEKMMDVLGPPRMVKVINPEGEYVFDTEPGVPEYLVPRAEFKFSSGICSTKVAIIDFGVAYHVDAPPKTTGIPLEFAPPEELLAQYPLGFASDIWALACTMSTVYTGLSPFGDSSVDIVQSIGKIEETIGPLPNPYRTAWKRDFGFEFANGEENKALPAAVYVGELWNQRQEYLRTHGLDCLESHCLHGKGGPLSITQSQADEINRALKLDQETLPAFTDSGLPTYLVPFHDRVKRSGDRDEAKLFSDFLRTMLKWNPDDRASIDMVIAHDWFEGRGGGNIFTSCTMM